MSSGLVRRLSSIYRNALDIKNKGSASEKAQHPPPGPQATSGKARGKSSRPCAGGKDSSWLANAMWDFGQVRASFNKIVRIN